MVLAIVAVAVVAWIALVFGLCIGWCMGANFVEGLYRGEKDEDGEEEMEVSTTDAIIDSINKWCRIYAGVGTDVGQENCGLCKMFWRKDCDGCPVAERTDRPCCAGSPYSRWVDHHNDDHVEETEYYAIPGCETCLEIAKEEIDFLVSLLPDDVRWSDQWVSPPEPEGTIVEEGHA